LAVFTIFLVPYLISTAIKYNTVGWKTFFEYIALFIGLLYFFLFGFDILKCMNLYRKGDMINLDLRKENNKLSENYANKNHAGHNMNQY
jgi:hypothetical protein